MGRLIDITGNRFGRLTVKKRAGSTKAGNATWECLCDCGATTTQQSTDLIAGAVISCGCYRKERLQEIGLKHGHAAPRTRTYEAWVAMRKRCRANKKYRAQYYDRGIRVCDRWSEFPAFLSDMGECPPGLTLDRIDNDGNYEPGNCRWATAKQQCNNTRRNRYIEHKGQRLTLAQWSRRTGLPYSTIWKRFHSGLTPAEILSPNLRRPCGCD